MTALTPTPDSDLLYSEQEEDLRAAVRSLLAAHLDTPALLASLEAPAGAHDARLWKALAVDMGLAGLLIPQELGGAGATHREAAVVLEELGRTVAPVPFLTSAVLATQTLLACDTTRPEVAALLTGLAEGRRTCALAVALSTSPYAPVRRAAATGAGLSGTLTSVADGPTADAWLVPADDGLYLVERDTAGARMEAMTALDQTRPLGRLTLDNATGTRLADAATAEAAIHHGLLTAAGLLASEQLGLADWCLTETVAYLKERRQFARQVGGFQALKHRLAHLWLRLVPARAVARHAADALATASPDTAIAVALAQSCTSELAVHAAEEALQLHGGIGMTWEHPVHLYLKRAKSTHLTLGTPATHHTALATLVDLPA
ncbi:acyl-CoA dehydrogenase family protein [Streptomyces polyrhachis]|uniref:Acyl-CoA dehydrogenase family protein n=1 Tax=Streptomyces polyrhachis TaxID=1282885 RepID=A0ABW2GJG1_9ACTN